MGLKRISIAASQTEIPDGRFGINNPQSAIRNPHPPHNAYFLSLKAYTEDGRPGWRDPADIHNQMRQFDVMTDRLIHGLMQLDAEWLGDAVGRTLVRP